MSKQENAWNKGQQDANQNKGPSLPRQTPYQVRESYNAGFQSGKQSGSGKSGK